MSATFDDNMAMIVNIAFASEPLATSPSWTEISSYVVSGSMSFGRDSELDDFSAGSLSIKVKNNDRRFDPDYASGAYAPNVLVGKKIQVKIVTTYGTDTIWTGFITSYTQEYDQNFPDYAFCTINATDALGFLGRINCPTDYFGKVIAADEPYSWYRLNEQAGVIAYDSSGNGYHGTHAGDVRSVTTQGVLPFNDGSAIKFANFWSINFMPGALGSASSGLATYEAWIRLDALPTATSVILADPGGGKIWLDTNGYVWAEHGDSYPPMQAGPLTLGLPHQIVLQGNIGGVVALFIDGVQKINVEYVNPTGIVGEVAPQAMIGCDWFYADKMQGTLDEVIIYYEALPAANILEHYNAGMDPLGTYTDAGARIGALLDFVGWPAADRTLGTGRTHVRTAEFTTSVAEYCKKMEAAEQGQFYADEDGKLVLRSRDWRFSNSAATSSTNKVFGDGGGSEYPYVGLDPVYDDRLIQNKIRVSRVGGLVQEVYDQASIDAYGEWSEEYTDLELNTDAEALALAQYRLDLYSQPSTRIEQITVTPKRTATLWEQIADRTIGERIQVKRRPQGVGTATSLDFHIEGVSHTFDMTSQTWETSYVLSPAAPATDWWILGVDLLGVGTTLGYY